MSKKSGRLLDIREAHHSITKAILFLDRNGLEGQVEALIEVLVSLPKPPIENPK